MASFKKTNSKLFSKPSQTSTPDIEYWKKLGVCFVVNRLRLTYTSSNVGTVFSYSICSIANSLGLSEIEGCSFIFRPSV